MKKQNNQGITLIALVITIIVLLILAGVSLRLVAGDEGILGRAEKAVNKSNTTSLKEEIELAISEARIAYYEGDTVDGATSASENIRNTLKNGISTSQGTVKLEGESLKIGETEIGTYDGAAGNITMSGESSESNPLIWANTTGTAEEWDVSSEGTLTYYKGVVPENGVITIPSKVDGITVEKIEYNKDPLSCIFYTPNAETGYYNSTIKEVKISDGIKIIGSLSFAAMKSLTTVSIPATVDTISDGVFSVCPNLTTVYYNGTKAQWNSININSYSKLENVTLICKDGTFEI